MRHGTMWKRVKRLDRFAGCCQWSNQIAKLKKNGWTIEWDNPVESSPDICKGIKSITHLTLGSAKTPLDACVIQNKHDREQAATYVQRMSDYLISEGWIFTEAGNWYRSNWDDLYEERQRARYMDDEGNVTRTTGFFGNLKQALRIQAKLDVEFAEETSDSPA